MHDLGIILWAVVIMMGLNVVVVAVTFGVKAARSIEKRRTKAKIGRLEWALDESLASGEVHPVLRHLSDRDMDLMATMMVEHLALVLGDQRERLVRLAEEAGLVRRYLGRLRSRGRWTKARAAENLGYFGGPEATAQLADLLRHRDETLRAVAARALARIGSPEAAEMLAQTLNDPSELTRLRMAENLERIGLPAVGPLAEVLERGNPPAQVLAAQVIGNLRVFEARRGLREAVLQAASPDLRAQAALALGRIADPEDISVLLEASTDRDWPVRAQAASALGRIGEVTTIPTLQELTLDREWWVRLNASRALANMGPAGEMALAALLESGDRYARERAAATLEERGITRQAVGELDTPGAKGEGARALIRAMVRVGAVRYLERLAITLPDEGTREALRRTMWEAREL